MKQKVLVVYKKVGETPLSVIKNIQQQYPMFTEEKISYAGRLDPMADGLLLLLIGEENKKRKDYEALAKTYVIEILLGVSTDTYDLLGLVTNINQPSPQQIALGKQQLQSLKGNFLLPYPPFSAKPVNGKPLYFWARENLLNTITIPQKNVTISSLIPLRTKSITGKKVGDYAYYHVRLVKGNFRQETISLQWKNFREKHKDSLFSLLEVEIACSSGTYMRTLAYLLGEKIGVPSLAFSIKRTKIGDFTLKDAVKLDDLTSVQ